MMFTPQLSQLLGDLSYQFVHSSPSACTQTLNRETHTSVSDVTNEQRSQHAYPVNLWQNGDTLELQVAVPGVNPAQLDLEILQDQLSVQLLAALPAVTKATEPSEVPAATKDVQPKTRHLLLRQLCLPFAVDAERAHAVCKDGILRIQLHRAQIEKPSKIVVQVGATAAV